MQAITLEKGPLAEQYVLENVSRLFPEYTLVTTKERLPGHHSADLHLKDKEGNDVFVEVKATEINKKHLGQILDYYSAILNYNPKKKEDKLKLILVGEKIDSSLKSYLDRLNIKFTSLNRLGFSYEKERNKVRNGLRTLTPTEAQLVLNWQAKGQKSVTIDMLVGIMGSNKNYASKLLRRLERKGWLSKISSGVYGFIPASYGYEKRFPSMNPFLIGSEIIEPYYFAYSTSNSHYGFSTQLPSTYYIATTKERPSYLWRNTRFQFITLSPKKFFGFREEEIFGVKVKIADPEKTLIDAVDKMQYCGGIEEVVSVLQRGLKQVDESKLLTYVAKMDSYTLNQRLGFIIDFLEKERLAKPTSRLRDQLHQKIGKSPIYLDTRRTRHGKYIRKWNIVLNVEDKELLSEIR